MLATQRINLLGMCANGILPKQSLLLRCVFSLAVVILSIVSAGCFPPKPLRVRSFVEVPVYEMRGTDDHEGETDSGARAETQ